MEICLPKLPLPVLVCDEECTRLTPWFCSVFLVEVEQGWSSVPWIFLTRIPFPSFCWNDDPTLAYLIVRCLVCTPSTCTCLPVGGSPGLGGPMPTTLVGTEMVHSVGCVSGTDAGCLRFYFYKAPGRGFLQCPRKQSTVQSSTCTTEKLVENVQTRVLTHEILAQIYAAVRTTQFVLSNC